MNSFIETPLLENLKKIPSNTRKSKILSLPDSEADIKIDLPPRPSVMHSARTVIFDFFTGQGVALTYQNKLCHYGVGYLISKQDNIFGRSLLKNFYSIPMSVQIQKEVTHVSVPKKIYDRFISENPKYDEDADPKKAIKISFEEKTKREDVSLEIPLFNGMSYYPLSELVRFGKGSKNLELLAAILVG